ncbi:hypothetical protein CLF_104561 [Clonorchis sinensis]|uniref:Reverse transcriptase domain-containing protein n=1 Tax=Clonorchis sinensis TaxID=79923 RepID=G7YBX0_CLOSI|nr:hypothetical protein CLF_104561 [Clonorchis sinensis]
MWQTVEDLQNSGVQNVAGGNIFDLEYADEIMLINEDEGEAQASLTKLTTVMPSFNIQLAPSKGKAMLQKVQSLNLHFTLLIEALDIAGTSNF